jgi:hypothetical protein
MSPDDRRLAREALESGRLTIAQVQELKADCESSGRSFADAAKARGLDLAPTPPSPPAPRPAPPPAAVGGARSPWPVVFALLGLVLLGLFAYTFRRAAVDLGGEHGDLDEVAKLRIETERRAYEARKVFERSVVARDDAQAKAAMDKGRAALSRAEEHVAAGRKPPVEELNEAVIGLTTYLERHPDDVDALLRRARACELRRFLDRALADLQKVSELRPAKAAELAPRIEAIRKQLPPPPK